MAVKWPKGKGKKPKKRGMQDRHQGWTALISAIHKATHGEQVRRSEIRDSLNYLWTPQGLRLSGFGFLRQFIRDPALPLSASALAMVIGTNMTPEVLCGLYDSIKDHGLYREDDSPHKVPRAVSGTGTGGKQIKTINVSTASAIVAASAGGMVLRSGTRSFFSSSGASDFLKAHNIPRITDLALVQPMIDETGLAFIEGEAFSPFSQYVKPLMRVQSHTLDLVKTLSHPYRLAIALLRPVGCEYAYRGISLPVTRTVAEALRLYRSFKRGLVVFGQDIDGYSFDELSNIGPNEVSQFNTDGVKTFTLWPDDVGLPLRQTKDIEVQDKEYGYTIATEIFQGKRAKDDPFTELLALNAGGVLYAGDFATDIREGVEKSLAAIEAGKPYRLIKRYCQAYSRLSTPKEGVSWQS